MTAGHRALAALLLVGIAAAAGDSAPAHATSFTVDSTADAVDANPGDGVCADATGACTLRAAVMETNALPGADTIDVPEGTYVLSIHTNQSCPDCGPFNGAEGDLDIREDLVLTGAGANATIIDASGLDRVFNVGPDPTVSDVLFEMSDVTVRNGVPHGNGGGGVFSWGDLKIMRSTVSDNAWSGVSARGALTIEDSLIGENSGAGIISDGSLTVMRTTVRGNEAHGIVATSQVTIRDSLVSQNATDLASGGGGAQFVAANAVITNSTFSSNSAGCFGGGIRAQSLQTAGPKTPSRVDLLNVTLHGNAQDCATQGGNIHSDAESIVRMQNTIVSNGGVGGDCSGPITSLGHNLDTDGTCGLSATGDISNVDGKLGPLANNGGSTLSHHPDVSSPVVDAGGNTVCPSADQTGRARPHDGDFDGLATCDIGAVEGNYVCACDAVSAPESTTIPNSLPSGGGRGATSRVSVPVIAITFAAGISLAGVWLVLRQN